jgi:hypothetical protein
MIFFPFVVWLLLRNPVVALILSFALYFFAYTRSWNLPAYPEERVWYFSPYAWQFLFVIGAWCALGGAQKIAGFIQSRTFLVLGGIYLLFAFGMQGLTNIDSLFRLNLKFPDALLIFPLDKTHLSPLRLLHFLILTAMVVRFVPANARFLGSRWAEPLILCGQHSLEIFCLGVFLSFSAHFLMVEVSSRIPMQIVVSLGGVLIMIALAGVMTWYKKLQNRAAKNPAT